MALITFDAALPAHVSLALNAQCVIVRWDEEREGIPTRILGRIHRSGSERQMHSEAWIGVLVTPEAPTAAEARRAGVK